MPMAIPNVKCHIPHANKMSYYQEFQRLRVHPIISMDLFPDFVIRRNQTKLRDIENNENPLPVLILIAAKENATDMHTA